ncbi:MAG: enoyl-CoA hydratase/isomerase family protein [Candidatus Tectomicrobia bacterium]|uniref:Enoyl-CoA hydratase/isomerase family protein n=1 Tax=Tectimicrobiota bacterium TaxID=2528274 RepID=A0A933GLM8_UNCTE|nr:enoyl-CoA hydratase/isomerase family protein [Candidatus Tectomicrobia bacterium]
MAFENIILEKAAGVAKITLNRPNALNALSSRLLSELETAVKDCESDKAIKVVVITGAGRAFSAGADLKELSGADPDKTISVIKIFHRCFNVIENLGKPVIAAINGLALAGGLELVMACDLAVLSEDAKIGDQHANFGLVPGGGGTQRLPRLIGIRRAKELMLTGVWLSPQEALEFGLVNKIAPTGKLMETVGELAKNLIKKSPMASKTIKYLVNDGMKMNLDDGLELEIKEVRKHFETKDIKEGLSAFLERREPNFPGE